MKRWITAALIPILSVSMAIAQDGAPDPTFGTGTFGPGRVVVAFNQGGDNSDRPRGVAVDAQGRIVVVGTLTTNNNSIIGVVRLLANGQLDPSFSSDGKATIIFAAAKVEASAVAIQPDGKVLVAGAIEFANNDEDFLVVRLLANGAVDTSFGSTGSRRIDFGEPSAFRESAGAISLGADGRILLAGITANLVATSRMGVARLTADGDLDTSFNGDGRKSFTFSVSVGRDVIRAVKELPDGRIVLAGSTSSTGDGDFAVVRLLESGEFDPAFGNEALGRSRVAFDLGGNNNDGASGLAISSSGSYFLAGSANLGNTSVIAVAKLDTSGALSPDFAGGGRLTLDFSPVGATYVTAHSVALLANGAIVLGGQAVGSAGFDFASARLNANGALDTRFGIGGRQLLGFDLGASNTDNGLDTVMADGHLVSVGSVQRAFGNGADRDFGILRQTLDLIFADGFD